MSGNCPFQNFTVLDSPVIQEERFGLRKKIALMSNNPRVISGRVFCLSK